MTSKPIGRFTHEFVLKKDWEFLSLWWLRRGRFAHFQEIWYTLPTEGGAIFFRVNSSLRRSRYRIVSAE